jgi:hypothetical protein
MKQKVVRLVLALSVLFGLGANAFAQGGATSAISGVVVDSTGGVVPGATITVKNEATNATFEAVSASNGAFTVPSLTVGSYTVTVQLQGFKTFVAKEIRVNAGGPSSIKATLEVGGLEQTVTVEAAAAMVQTTTSSVSKTIDLKQISNLPLASRNAIDFMQFLPGVVTASTVRNSSVNGLPQSSINITVDGLSVQDNYLKSSDGFFARMSPRLDSVEEVTVTTAGNGADSSGQGATQIKFATRSGSNQLSGSLYHYYQNDALNTNTYFNKRDNLAKPDLLLNQYGGRLGGPVVIPKLYDGHNKAFFFVNYEEFRQPSTSTLNRTVLTTGAAQGLFTYNITGGTRTVDLLKLAADNKQLATLDPTMSKLLADIRAAASPANGTITALTNPIQERFSWQTPVSSINRYPTVRMDYNLSDRHKLNGSFNFNDINSRPDTTNSRQASFPGFPVSGDQISDRYTVGANLRSTFGKNIVNEVRIGGSGGASLFSPGLNLGMYTGSTANQLGHVLSIGNGATNAGFAAAPSSREASTKIVGDTLSWQKGSHSITTGGEMTQVDLWLKNQSLTPTVAFDVITGDPALAMFTAANFPGSAAADVTNARNLYAMLTGRISAVTATSRLGADGKYIYAGEATQRGRQREFDVFLQDNWRARPDLSVNVGLRYVMQLPFYSTNDTYSTATLDSAWGISGNKEGCDPSNPTPATCNLFKPGTTPGVKPTLVNFSKGTKAFNTDWNNLAPSIGLNWTPAVSNGFLHRVIGNQGDTAFSAGFARSYNRNGIGDYSDVFGANQGITLDTSRNASLGNLGGLPRLLRNPGALDAPAFNDTPVYPATPVITGTVNLFDPNLQVPYSDTWTAGIQRSIGRKSAVVLRYVGTRSREQWTAYDFNAPNIIENGYLDEFKNAQKNLQANIAANRGATFKYFGAGTGTVPLPIYQAYFSGVNAANAGNAALYTSSNYTSTNFINPLAAYNPNPYTAAGTNANTGLDGDATRRANALAAGLPRNFFRANPDVLGGALVTGYGGYTKYNAMQVEFRRRLSDGLQVDANYSLGRGYGSSRYSFRVDRKLTRSSGAEGDVTHALKGTFVYDLPFGQGRHFGSNVGRVMDAVIGGWNISGTTRIQSGRLVDFGNVRMVGFTAKDLPGMYKVRKDSATGKVWILPQDVIDNTVKAFSTSASSATGYGALGAPTGKYFAPAMGPDCLETIAAGYGDCGTRSLIATGPKVFNLDMSVTKNVKLMHRASLQLRLDALNMTDFVAFTPVTGLGTSVDAFEITGATSGRTLQIVTRISW